MPGEIITIRTERYPELRGLEEGDSVRMTVTGKISMNDGETVEVETESIETEADDAAQFQKKMSKQPNMPAPVEEGEDYE